MYVDVLLFAAIFVIWRKFEYVGFDECFKWFGAFAPISYALYVIHFPLLGGLRLFSESSLFYFDLTLRVLIIFALSWLLEIPFQKFVTRVTSRFIPN